MNSSLLVPALCVVAVTAGVFVFGDSLFSGDSSDAVSKKVTNYSTKAKETADAVAVTTSSATGSDFSWDEDSEASTQSPISTPTKSYVSKKQIEDAPGDLYGENTDSDKQAADSFDSVEDFGLSNDPSDLRVDDFEPALDTQAASKQVDDGLGGFFNNDPKAKAKATASDSSAARSSVRKSVQKPSAPTTKTVDKSDFDVALVSPKASERNVDAFDDIDPELYDSPSVARTKVKDEMKSVVMPEPKKTAPKKSVVTTKDSDADSVISGALEPMTSDKRSSMAASNSSVSIKTPVRKFKITNPKETTLAVTLSVDGKQVTLKPDQSYVIQESDGEVEVSFSRGGSFGIEKKTLRKGHYRFTVSREAGWQLIN